MTERHQHIVAVILALVSTAFISVIVVFILLPALNDIRGLSRDIIDAQAELEAQYANRKNLLESIANVNRIRQTTDDLMSQFIVPGEELVFITRIEEVSSTTGVESTIRLSGVQAKAGAAMGHNDTFEIGLVGTYPSVLKTIRNIETLPNLTIIDAVSIRAGDLFIGSPTVISASVRGRIAFIPEGI